MSTQSLPTYFAPAQRASIKGLQQQAQRVANIPLIRPLFDAIPDIVLILNAERQIVFANRALLDFAHLETPGEAIGFRPGEALDCVHAFEMESGCGTTHFCQTCGAAQAILSSQGKDGVQMVEECRISLHNGDALDLLVYATPMVLDRGKFTLFVLKDISHEKRRQMLEHVFFHDILNSVGGLHGLVQVLRRAPEQEKDEIVQDISDICERLIDEIKSQKELVAAENNELNVENKLIWIHPFLEDIVANYRRDRSSEGKEILCVPDCAEMKLETDPVLLRRVIVNMLRNALEASLPGETVTLGCHKATPGVEFWVHNPGRIPDNVQLEIFKRSFSTKGEGRGLGTYSIKLLGERYLLGQVSFTSSIDQGTVFRILIPAVLEDDFA